MTDGIGAYDVSKGLDNILLDTVMEYLPYGSRSSNSNWTKFNGPCCTHRGDVRSDTKLRSGLIASPDGSFAINCFNCGMKVTWKPGNRLSKNMIEYMEWLGVPDEKIKKVRYKVSLYKELTKNPTTDIRLNTAYNTVKLPENAMPIRFWLDNNLTDPDFIHAMEYLYSRGPVASWKNYHWSPSKKDNMNQRLIIPFTWNDEIVGWTARATVDKLTRYFSNLQSGYMFNLDNQPDNWKYLFLCEGPFDAIAINGVATLGDKISDKQAKYLSSLGKEIIVVPDRTNSGGNLLQAAVKYDWSVSTPDWRSGIKDAADAVQIYGKLFTVYSLIDSRTNGKLQINLSKNKIK